MKNATSIAILLAACASAAHAQAVYKCGATYSQAACDGAVVVAQGDSPTAHDAKAAHDRAVRDQKLADSMEKARLKQEAKPVAAYIPTRPDEARDERRKVAMVKPEKVKYFTAVSSGDAGAAARKKKKKGS